MEEAMCCVLRELPHELQADAAQLAVMRCPNNAPLAHKLDIDIGEERVALLATRWWGAGGVDLGVCFLDTNDRALQERLLSHFNAWGEQANVLFRLSDSQSAPIRVTRTRGGGYWSHLGTDCLLVPAGQPTMNLDSFTMSTPESEYRRGVRHEAGHAIGFAHEHLRKALIDRIDRTKAMSYYRTTQGWSEEQVQRNVLRSAEESTLVASSPDATSIMCYHIPGAITKDGQDIEGGTDINQNDHALTGKVYPRPAKAPAAKILVLEFSGGYRILP